MNYLIAVKEFFFPTVESTLRTFTKTQSRLTKIAERSRAKSAKIGDQVNALLNQRTELSGEALRADRIASKISSLIN